MKRLIALLLTCGLLLSLLTGLVGAVEPQDLWDQIIALENVRLRKTRAVNSEVMAADFAALSQEVAALVVASDDYTDGTCTYDGTNAAFFWENADGEPQFYSPSLRAKIENGSNGVAPASVGTTETASYAVRGGNPNGKNAYVIGPWYGSDDSFTNQYKAEGNSIASALGGKYTLYSGTNATIDNVAAAMQDGAVVFFDSHGVTDYDEYLGYSYPDSVFDAVYDSVTEANTSYLTLTTGAGLTAADKTRVTGKFAPYYHASSFESTDGDMVYCVDGTVIANHMTKNAPNSLLWMAICLGMATEGISAPLHSKGVEVIYGYSQSISFDGDYEYEEHFWNSIKNGKTVAEAVSAMKTRYGNWDPAYYSSGSYYNTIEKARKYFIAFPVVVSSEDVHPGQRSASSYGADSLQTVKSTWTLMASCVHSYAYSVTTAPTLTTAGALTGTCSKCSGTTTVTLPKLDTTNYTYQVQTESSCTAAGAATYTLKDTSCGSFCFEVTLPAASHAYITAKTDPTCTERGYTTHTCTKCGDSYQDTYVPAKEHTEVTDAAVAATCTAEGKTEGKHCADCKAVIVAQTTVAKIAHSYSNGVCTACGAADASLFTDIPAKVWYREAVEYAAEHGLMSGVETTAFGPEENMTRGMLVTVLWRYAGRPENAEWKNTFRDVPDGRYFTKAIVWAANNGIVSGIDEGIFGPDENVTREQLAAILFRYAQKLEPDTDARGSLDAFSDKGSVSNYAKDAIGWAVAKGIMSGNKEGERLLLDPKGNATRAQVASMLMRYIERDLS